MCWTERLFSMFVSQRGRAFLIILHWTANRASFWVLTAAKRLSHAVHPQELCSSQNPHQTARFNLGAICAAWNSRVPIRSLQWNEPTGVATPPNLGQGAWAARVRAARSSWASIAWPKVQTFQPHLLATMQREQFKTLAVLEKGGKSICAMFPFFPQWPTTLGPDMSPLRLATLGCSGNPIGVTGECPALLCGDWRCGASLLWGAWLEIGQFALHTIHS